MISKEERRARLQERSLELIRPVLQPGETVTAIVPVQTRPRGTHGFEFVLGRGMLAFIHWWVVAVSDRRLFLLDCGCSAALSDFWKPKTITWDEPLAAIQVEKFKQGWLYTKLYLRRVADPQRTIRLHAPGSGRSEINEVAQMLGSRT